MAERVLMMDCGDTKRRADVGCAGKGPIGKAADYAISGAETGTIFTNKGATGAVIFTLPVPKPGYRFTFVKAVVAQNLVVKAPAAVKINSGTANQVYKNVASEMGTLTLVGISATEYAVQSEKGTWANAAS